jgi:hypothetical protein
MNNTQTRALYINRKKASRITISAPLLFTFEPIVNVEQGQLLLRPWQHGILQPFLQVYLFALQ